MGLIMLQILGTTGASEVVVVDAIDFRLEFAKRFGASAVVNVMREKPVERILQLFPSGADVVVEATGNPLAFQSACDVVKEGGALIVISIFSGKAKELDLSFLYNKEPIIYGSKGAQDGFPEALQLLKEKRLKTTPMITHRFPLEETEKAFQTFEDTGSQALRVLIEPTV